MQTHFLITGYIKNIDQEGTIHDTSPLGILMQYE